MVHGGWFARGLICVKAPALLLPFLYRFADLPVVIDLHTFPLIHIAHLLIALASALNEDGIYDIGLSPFS
jgi:hypothetical protein